MKRRKKIKFVGFLSVHTKRWNEPKPPKTNHLFCGTGRNHPLNKSKTKTPRLAKKINKNNPVQNLARFGLKN